MAESSSSNQAIVETGAAVVATPGELPATLPPVVHDANGVPVVDLREAPGKDGAFVVVDGELVIRLADGTEWPVSTNGTSGEIVLQLADQAFVGASAVAAALESFDTALPVAELAETALREAGAFPASAVETVATETVATPQGEAPAEGAAEDRVGRAGQRWCRVPDTGAGVDRREPQPDDAARSHQLWAKRGRARLRHAARRRLTWLRCDDLGLDRC